ncbi:MULTISPECIES: YciI family protein [unclassified Marinomonas]|uniref:YciI family protein n=1 Tax=unclassified Marinomonas TaxID=196814 RepID=UPI0009ED361E|nr:MULTISPECIES: YciI family protein [unclassified Marinomonas]
MSDKTMSNKVASDKTMSDKKTSNKTYMCILRSESEQGCDSSSSPSPSEMEAMYAKYQAWQEKFADNIKDMGGKLSGSASVVRQSGVDDGPFIELKEIVGGYMMISAADMEEAVAVINQSPRIESPNVSIEIREIWTPE